MLKRNSHSRRTFVAGHLLTVAAMLLVAACSDNDPPFIVDPPQPPDPPPPPTRMADPLPDPISADAAALQLGSGFATAFTNLETDPLVDDPEINDIDPVNVDMLPLNILDPS